MRWKALILLVLLGAAGWSYGKREWDGRTRFTVVSVGQEVEVWSFDPQTRDGVRVKLPGNLEVETVGGRGRIKSQNLELAAQKFGGKSWAADSVADYLGIGYIGDIGSLSFWDRWRWWWIGRGINWTLLSMGEGGWTQKVVAVDGEVLLRLSDSWVNERGKWFLDSAVASEGVRVTLVNTTQINGLGAHAAIALETAGMRVREIRNEIKSLKKCRLMVRKESKKTFSVFWIVRNYTCQWESDDSLNTDELIVELGGDYQKWWLGE